MKSVLVATAASAMAAPTFTQWAAKHGKEYTTREELVLRRAVYAANVAKIEAHNAAGHTWTMGVNKFADMLPEEFKARMTGGYRSKGRTSIFHVDQSLLNAPAPPATVNWTANGAVTPVKDQAQCGSCWAFSTTGSTEGIVFLKTGTLPSLSEQQLVSCSKAEGNQGCNGGLMDYGFQFIIDNKGIASEAAYPYTSGGGVDGTCKTGEVSVATITGYSDVPAGSDTALMAAIAVQPISVAVEADQNSFQFYTSGVMTAACGTALDHGVLAVGYGTDATGGDYYTVKNSWGASWGSNGYILLGRGAKFNPNGQCGIQMESSFPTKTA